MAAELSREDERPPLRLLKNDRRVAVHVFLVVAPTLKKKVNFNFTRIFFCHNVKKVQFWRENSNYIIHWQKS